MRGTEQGYSLDDCVDKGCFAAGRAAYDHDVFASHYSVFKERHHGGRDNAIRHVVFNAHHLAGLFAERKRRSAYNGRKGRLEPGPVQRKFPFDDRGVIVDRQIQSTGHQGEHGPTPYRLHCADRLLILSVPLDPQHPVRVQHNFNHFRIFQGIHEQRAAVVGQRFPKSCIRGHHHRTPRSTNTATLTRAETATMAAAYHMPLLRLCSWPACSANTLRMPSTEDAESCAAKASVAP